MFERRFATHMARFVPYAGQRHSSLQPRNMNVRCKRKVLKLSTLSAYTSPGRCSPHTHQSPHTNSPSPPEPLEPLPSPSLPLLPNHSYLHGRCTCCALHQICRRASFAFFVDDRAHGPKQAAIGPDFDDRLHVLSSASGSGHIHLPSSEYSFDRKLHNKLDRLPNECCNRIHIRG